MATILQHAVRYGQLRLSRRMSRSVPWIGMAIALIAVGAAIRRKGLLGGTIDTALDAVPVLGAAKNAAEAFRGRDFIPDRNSGHGVRDSRNRLSNSKA